MVEIIGIITAFNLLILSIYIFVKRSVSSQFDSILALIIFLVAYTQLMYLLYASGFIKHIPSLTYSESISISSVLPLFYIYLSVLLENKKAFIRKNLKHLIPILPGIFYLFYFNILPEESQQYSLTQKKCGLLPDEYLYVTACIFQLLYCLLSLKKMNTFYYTYKRQMSASDISYFRWLFCLIYGFFIMSTLFIVTYLVITNETLIDRISTIFIDFLFVFILLFLFNRPAHYAFKVNNIIHNKENNPTISDNSILSKTIESEIKGKKLFLENLTLAKISKHISIPEYKISQVINQQYKMTVPDFINYLRVEYAKEKLYDANTTNLKMDYLAKECGFNTRTSFYAAFKKFNNCTPAQFRTNNKTMPSA